MVPRKKQEPIDPEVARCIGGLLRGLRRSAGYRAVKDAAAQPECPAAQQTIYAYERGGLVPSLKQFMELVEFDALQSESSSLGVRYQGVEEVLFPVGMSYIQLLGALGPDTPVGRFLDRRGEGIHHVGYRVEDVRQALTSLRAAGVPLIDESPRPGSRGTTVAFVHPK